MGRLVSPFPRVPFMLWSDWLVAQPKEAGSKQSFLRLASEVERRRVGLDRLVSMDSRAPGGGTSDASFKEVAPGRVEYPGRRRPVNCVGEGPWRLRTMRRASEAACVLGGVEGDQGRLPGGGDVQADSEKELVRTRRARGHTCPACKQRFIQGGHIMCLRSGRG